MGATDILGRIATSLYGMETMPPTFTVCHDVPAGGVLLALPALLAIGLLRHSEEYFKLPAGFYRLDSIFLVLAFMALARIKSVEKLRYCSPGEWGKLLGLDRIPETKTLREKIGILSRQGEPYQWAGKLSQEWMEIDPEAAGVLSIDGHVRVYNGHQTELPRHSVSRQKLCLGATTDYWVNAMDGQPFFVINKEIDPGCMKRMREKRSAPISKVAVARQLQQCLPAGHRKISSDLCVSTIILTALPTILPKRYLSRPRWSTPSIGRSDGRVRSPAVRLNRLPRKFGEIMLIDTIKMIAIGRRRPW